MTTGVSGNAHKQTQGANDVNDDVSTWNPTMIAIY